MGKQFENGVYVTNSPEEAIENVFSVAFTGIPDISKTALDEQFSQSERIWGSTKLFEGTQTEIKPLLFNNLLRISKQAYFTDFNVKPILRDSCVQVQGHISNPNPHFVPVRIWRIGESFFVCGNAKFEKPENDEKALGNSKEETENILRVNPPVLISKKRKQIREILNPLLKQNEKLEHWAIAKTKMSLWHVLLAPVFLFLAPLLIVTWSGPNIKLSDDEGSGYMVGFLIAILIIGFYIYFLRKGISKFGVGLTDQRLIIVRIGKNESQPIQYNLTNLTKSIVSVGVFVNLIINAQERTLKLVFANNTQDNRDEGIEIMKAMPGNRFPTSQQTVPTTEPLVESIQPKQPQQMETEKPPAYTPPPNQATAWIRGLALLVDVILLVGIAVGISIAVYGTTTNTEPIVVTILYILCVVGFIALEASRYKASIGKLIFRLKVVEDRDKPLTLVRIIVRNIIKWGTLPLWVFYIPFYYLTNIKPLFTKPITTLHDILTLTTVVRNIKESK